MKALLDGQCLALDTETTGTSVDNDRIVTACATIVEHGKAVFEREWLIAVDIDIPQGATDVHGITTEHARANGIPPIQGIKEIANAVRYAVHSGIPIVAYNAAFDLSILNAECVRNGLGTLAEFCGRDIVPVVDPFTIDKRTDRYRKGKRQLGVTCEFFGIVLENAHTAGADAFAAAAVARCLAERSQMDAGTIRDLYADRRFPNEFVKVFQALGRMSLAELHAAQVQWYADQAEGLGDYWRKEANQKRHEAELARSDADTDPTSGDAAAAIAAAEVLKQEAAELDARVDGLSIEWPIRSLPVVAVAP